MRSITDVVGHFKQSWTQQLSETGIAEACRESGMTWIGSTLDPITTVQIFVLQILHGNTACEHMSHLARMTFTGAAYCKAPMRVKLDLEFQELTTNLNAEGGKRIYRSPVPRQRLAGC